MSPSIQAVIVEPRKHAALKMVVDHMCDKLPTVPIVVIHGTANKTFAHQEIASNPCVGKGSVLELNADNLNAESYSKLLTSTAFWEQMQHQGAEKTLVFQTDSGICGTEADLEQFLAYDYCGAPWRAEDRDPQQPALVGNGGLSLRTTAIALRHVQENGAHTYFEDKKFSGWCHEDPECTLCSVEVAKTFATESVPSATSWAFHNNWKFGGEDLCDINRQVRQAQHTIGDPLPDAPPVDDWDPVLTPSTQLR
tara:strand:- start:380 stop:1135 length:756 start_codon:yes stop_codon:yes gene_type:complete